MNDNISSFNGGDWVDILKEIRKLNQSKKDEIEFLYKDYLKGELILAFRKCVAGYFKMRGNTQEHSKLIFICRSFYYSYSLRINQLMRM